MTKSEFSAWVKVTDGSASRWTLDENRWHNNEEMLFYKGGQDGKFIWIYRDGMMHLGTYEMPSRTSVTHAFNRCSPNNLLPEMRLTHGCLNAGEAVL